LPSHGSPQPTDGGHDVRAERLASHGRRQTRGPGRAGCGDPFSRSESAQVVRSGRPLTPITIRSVRETSQPQPRSPLDAFAERLLLLPRSRWSGYIFGAAAVSVATAVVGVVMDWTRLANSSAVYTIPVLLTAALYGRGPAPATSVLAFVAYDAWFADPTYPHSVTSPREWLTLLVFLVTALVAGQLAVMLRRHAERARQREREALALYEVAKLVSGSTLGVQPLLGLILDQLETIVEYDAAAIILRDAAGATVVFDYRGKLPREQLVGLHVQAESALREVVDGVVRRREPMLVEDLGGQSLIAQNLLARGVSVPPAAAHSELAVPLIVKEQVIGVQNKSKTDTVSAPVRRSSRSHSLAASENASPTAASGPSFQPAAQASALAA